MLDIDISSTYIEYLTGSKSCIIEVSGGTRMADPAVEGEVVGAVAAEAGAEAAVVAGVMCARRFSRC
jgi:hypothetical protein